MTKSVNQRHFQRYLWRLAEVIALLVLVTIVCFLFAWAFPIILPFVTAWFAAIMLLPFVKVLEKRGLPRMAATITVLTSLLVLIVIISVYAIVAVVDEATTLTVTVTHQFAQIQTWIYAEVAKGQVLFGQLSPSVASNIESTASGILKTAENTVQQFVSFLLNSLSNLPDTIFVVVISVIATYFMLINRERMYGGFLRVLPPGWAGKMNNVISDMMKAFVGTLRAQVVLMLMSAVLGVIGMLALGIQYAVILGILFAITGIVPIIGSAILTVPWAIGALVLGDVPLALKILLVQVFISLIRHIVEPKILADSVGLDTLSTLFALYAGLQIMGVLGLFFGPIILIGTKSLLRKRMFVDLFPDDDTNPFESGVRDEAESKS